MTLITKIPLPLIISAKMKLVPQEFSAGLKLKYISGALLLVSEKMKENSLWKPYIDILPEKEGITHTFTTEEMGLLEGSKVRTYMCGAVMYTLHASAVRSS